MEGTGSALPEQYSPSFLTYFKSSGLSFGEGGRRREWVLEVVLMVGGLKLGDSDPLVYWAFLRDLAII